MGLVCTRGSSFHEFYNFSPNFYYFFSDNYFFYPRHFPTPTTTPTTHDMIQLHSLREVWERARERTWVVSVSVGVVVSVGKCRGKNVSHKNQTTSSPPFFLRDSRARKTRARVKITPREKRRHAAGREKNHLSLSPPRVAFSRVG